MTLLAAATCTAALLAPSAARAQTADACQQTPQPGSSGVSVVSGGIERTAVLHVPSASSGQRLPLLIGLHGAGGGFFESYSGLSVLADAERFIAVYPSATDDPAGHGFWNINDHRAGAPNDVQFISDLIDSLQGVLCVDATRIYVAGVSNGGGMAVRLACELSGRIAAIASVAGGYASLPPCQPRNPVSVLEVHGTLDGVVPYWGDPFGAGSVRTFLAAWTLRDGCHQAARVSRVAARVRRYLWMPCADGTAVEHLEIEDGGHQLPGGLPPDHGQSSTISTSWLIWRFLRAHRLAPPYPAASSPSAPAPAGPARRRSA
jgi:polyhydroxybutyrate depolymerase